MQTAGHLAEEGWGVQLKVSRTLWELLALESGELFDTKVYNIIRHYQNIDGCGVLIATKCPITHTILTTSSTAETVTILIGTKTLTPLTCRPTYRPPSNADNFIGDLIKHRQTAMGKTNLPKETNHRIIGEFNYPCINWHICPLKLKEKSNLKRLHQNVIRTINEENLNQLIKEPTHVQENILDPILTNNLSLINSINVMPQIWMNTHQPLTN